MKTKFFKILIVLLSVIIVIALSGFFIFTNMLSPVVADKTSEDFIEFTVKIPRGAGLKVVGENLYENNMIKSPLAFYVYSRLVKPVVKAGVYKIDNALSVKEILSVFESGKQAQIVVSIPEGLTMRRIGELLEKNDVVSKDDFLSACKSTELLQKYNLDNIENYSKMQNIEIFVKNNTFLPLKQEEIKNVKIEYKFFDEPLSDGQIGFEYFLVENNLIFSKKIYTILCEKSGNINSFRDNFKKVIRAF